VLVLFFWGTRELLDRLGYLSNYKVSIRASADDALTGGTGIDTFVLRRVSGGIDTITDFGTGGADRLDVTSFRTNPANPLNFNVRSGAGFTTALNGNHLFIFNTTDKALYFDADGSGNASTAVQIATLAGVTGLTNANFIG
jgi:Ca2+-binding RTX toxin-like protein